jgi:hypothetical protein
MAVGTPIVEERRSGWAVGYTVFAGVFMITAGIWHAISGLTGILEDKFYAVTPNYIFEFDATTWGWIHLILGIVVTLAGFALFTGSVWARSIAVVLAVFSMIVNFAFIPFYPLWSIVIIALDIGVIWAVTAHGRDTAEYMQE